MNKGTQEKSIKGAYEIGKARGDLEVKRIESEMDAIREESGAIGALEIINCNVEHNKILKYGILHRIKKSKDYKKGGRTWEEFCDFVGEPRRTIDQTIKEVKPFVEKYLSIFANLTGVTFNNIRYLGQSVSAGFAGFDGESLIYEGRKIPITPEHAEDINALIDSLRDAHRKEKEKLESKIDRLEKSKNQIINEEIEGLNREKKYLIDENERLKKFDIEGKDLEWSLEQAKEIAKAAHSFCVLCRKFVMDERLEDDIELQAKVEGSLAEARTAILSLNNIWDERFNS